MVPITPPDLLKALAMLSVPVPFRLPAVTLSVPIDADPFKSSVPPETPMAPNPLTTPGTSTVPAATFKDEPVVRTIFATALPPVIAKVDTPDVDVRLPLRARAPLPEMLALLIARLVKFTLPVICNEALDSVKLLDLL